MGLFGGSTTTTTNEKFDSGPSSFQRPYLDSAFGGAKDALGSQQNTPWYQGDLHAGMTPEAKAALAAMRGYATNTALGGASTISGIGSRLSGYADKAGDMIGGYANASSPDAIASAATKYVNNPLIQGQIDAAAGDVRRNLTESVLPGIDRAASAGGNINSSRAGIASGIAQRGAADSIAQIGAGIRGNAWNQGLSMAQDAANSKLTAGRAYADLGSQGIDALNAGNSAAFGAYDRINGTFGQEQANQQGELDADYARWTGNDNRAWDVLSKYMGVVGNNQWGQSGTSSGTTTVKNKQSLLSGILGAASVASSFIPGLGK